MPTLAPMTELDAVNIMLGTIGEAPVSTLLAGTATDALVAYNLLQEENRRMQASGWSWNSEEAVPFSPDVDGNVWLPSNVVSADQHNDWYGGIGFWNSQGVDLVQRGNRLYDKANHTFKITLPIVYIDMTYLLAFSDMPENAKNYITISAARRFADRYLGDQAVHMFSKQDEDKAWSNLTQDESDSGDYNVLKDSPDIKMTLRRRYRYR